MRAGIQTGVNVGDAIPVYYDPHDPSQATIYAPGRSLLMVAVLGVNGAITLPLAAMLGLWLGPLQAARDDTLAEFIYAVRSDNSARISSLSATGAQVTPEFVARAKKSGAHRLGSNNIGFSSDACVEVFFDSDPRPHYVYMQKPSDWRIVRANANDPYCIDDLRD